MRAMLFILAATLAGLAPRVQGQSNTWTTLASCRLNTNPANDGDSFHVRHGGTTYLFRLYFVDCPETHRQVPSRVRKQAEYWEVDEEAVLARAADAAKFTRRLLRRPFTVQTRWQDARGQSRKKRHFAFVTTGEGKDLAAELLRSGYARAYGASAPRPDGTPARETWKRLDDLEDEAKEAGRGCWGRK